MLTFSSSRRAIGNRNVSTGPSIDRGGSILASLTKNYLPFFENKVLLRGDQLGWSNFDITEGNLLVFLGTSHNSAFYGIDLKVVDNGLNGSFCTPREALDRLSTQESRTFLWGNSLIKHHKQFLFCPTCKQKLFIDENRACACGNCLLKFFPRVDPVIITLIINGNRCLLCRLPTSPKRRYSCVAGFLEPGESIEECVAREVFEEVGITVDTRKVKYILSEPWPTEIGSNLMIGCSVEVNTDYFKLNTSELEDALWVDVDHVRNIFSRVSSDYVLPEHYTTARKLLDYWSKE